MKLQMLFVYGTLQRGLSRHVTLREQTFIGTARTVHEHRLFDCGGYPGLVRSSPGSQIQGEVFAVSPDCLAVCDTIEAVHEGLYARRRIDIQVDAVSRPQLVWAYFFEKSTAGLKDCGACWLPPPDSSAT